MSRARPKGWERGARVLALLGLLPLVGRTPAWAANEACLSCHAKKVVTGYVDPQQFGQSIHGKLRCVQCHSDVSEKSLPHAPRLQKVTCANCHATGKAGAPNVAARIHAYEDSIHGVAALQKGVKEAPTCATCHGTHDIFPARDPRSKVYHATIPQTCGKCHSDQKLVDKFHIPKGQVLEFYERSIHGQILARVGDHGARRVAVCTDCHGAHNIQPGSVATSSVARANIPQTCGNCHTDIKELYLKGIHGQAVSKGIKEAPVCTSCHGEHTIRSPQDTESSVYPTHIVATCGKCHESKAIQAEFGLPERRVETFKASYHGIALRFGQVQAANCATCHGAHEILPASDPRSTVNPRNIPTTCGKCHPNAGANFARGKVHVEELPESNLGVYLVALAYRWIIWAMFAFFIVMIALDLGTHVRERRRGHPPEPPLGNNGSSNGGTEGAPPGGANDPGVVLIERMSLNARIQHILLMISLVTLMATGLPLRMKSWGWLEPLLTFPGSFALRATLHRMGAVLLIAVGCYHILYVIFSRRGHTAFMQLLPTRQDFRDFFGGIAYSLGLTTQRPRSGRFGWIEKFEYFAVAWGSVVMVGTGLILWFMVQSMAILPKWAWDTARALHSFEGLLAFVAIIVWHLYTVHLKPSVFPMSKVWLTGKITARQMEEEHPLEYEEWKKQHDGSESN